jgi:CRP/FNR family transcriptional regulator, cyclic AMP receptor protein
MDTGRGALALEPRLRAERAALYPVGISGYYRTAMPDESLKQFSRAYAPGAVICREGEDGVEMYIIQKGKVRVSKSFAGKPDIISVLGKGDFFGEMAIVNRIRRTATVTAIDEVELLVFDREGLQSMIARNPRIALTIIDKLCRRLQTAHLKIQHLVKRDARGLILLHLRSLFQELPDGSAGLPFQRCLEETSMSLELPMEEVRAELHGLQGEGVLEVAAESLRMKDPAAFARLAESVGG